MTTQLDPSEKANSVSKLAWAVAVTTLCRLVQCTARRFAYPFAPVLSRGLGVPLTAVTSLIALNWSTGVLCVFFGPLSDRLGYRRMMILGLVILAVGLLAGALLPFYGVVMVALFMAGLGKGIFDPAVQAYMSERVPYHRRGMVIGLMEFSWAGSTLVGIPLLGILIDRLGWRSPFFALGGMGLVGLVAVLRVMPADRRSRLASGAREGIWRTWRCLFRERQAMYALAIAFLLNMCNDILFVVYGVWLEQSFSLGVVALGLSTSVIGVAELIGEILTASLTDRMGAKRAVTIGMLLTIASYALLPLAGGSLTQALGGLFVLFLVFEFTVVSFLSICTELVPGNRATMLSGFYAAAGPGRVVGALVGGVAWVHGGIWAVGIGAALTTTLALATLLWGLKAWK